MAQLDSTIEQRARTAVACLSRFAAVTAAYLFGSQVDGTADRSSDIDVAVFVEGVQAWDLHDRARMAALIVPVLDARANAERRNMPARLQRMIVSIRS